MAEQEAEASEEPDILSLGGSGGDASAPVGGPAFSSGGTTGSAFSKVVVVKNVPPAPPWDPLSSPDWDKESHTKEALLRIKRYVACKEDW